MRRSLLEAGSALPILDRLVLDDFCTTVGAATPTLLHTIVASYLTEAPGLLDEAALALAAGNVRRCATLLHRLQGSSLSLGALRLAQACLLAEQQLGAGTGQNDIAAMHVEYREVVTALLAYLHTHGVILGDPPGQPQP